MEPSGDEAPKPGARSTKPYVFAGLALLVLVAIGSALAGGQDRPARPTPLLSGNSEPTAAAPAATNPEGQWIEWTSAVGPRIYTVAGYTIAVAAVRRDELDAARFTFTDGAASTELVGNGTPWGASAKVAIIRLAEQSSAPLILVTSFSGGAHCCSSLTALEVRDGAWRQHELGSWDGDSPSLPADLDNDGAKEFQFVDQAFLYAFTSYADSWAPPEIYRLTNGRLRDVSTEPGFRPLFQKAAADAREACLQNSNGACAAYVASAARLGRLDEAWSVMLRSYDQQTEWTYPTACRVRTASACPEDAVLKFGSYPEALQWFIGEQGYGPRVYVEPLRAAGPSFECGGVRSAGELSVCSDPALALLDRTLAVVFTRAMALSRDRSALRDAQRAFLRERNAAVDLSNLPSLYEARINQLLAVDEG